MDAAAARRLDRRFHVYGEVRKAEGERNHVTH